MIVICTCVLCIVYVRYQARMRSMLVLGEVKLWHQATDTVIHFSFRVDCAFSVVAREFLVKST